MVNCLQILCLKLNTTFKQFISHPLVMEFIILYNILELILAITGWLDRGVTTLAQEINGK